MKDGENMTVDSAIWYLQGTANFTYGTASQQTAKTVIDSTFITLMLTDSIISLTEVWNKYSDMIDSIRVNYHKIVGDQKQLMSVLVQERQLTKSELVCKVTSIFCNGDFPDDTCSFNNIDSWIWWNTAGQGGICAGQNSGQGNGLDAAQLINQKIMHCKGIPIGSFYWGEPVTVDLEANSYPNPAWNGVDINNEEFRMYWNDTAYPNCHPCIPPDECNFYLEGTRWVVNTPQSSGGAMPDGKSFMSIAIHGDEMNDFPNNGDSEYLHRGPAYYGTIHWSTTGAAPLD